MFTAMHKARGVGLAAQQVGHTLQLAVLDVREVTDRPSTLELAGQPADVLSIMPLVLINPEIKPVGPPFTGSEGCLSFPEIFAEITRPESVEVTALNEKGKHSPSAAADSWPRPCSMSTITCRASSSLTA